MASDGQTLPPVIAEIQANDDQLDEVIDRAKEKLDDLAASTADPSITLNDEGIDERIDGIEAKLEEISGTDVTATIGVEDEEAQERIDRLWARLAELDAEAPRIRPKVDIAPAEAELATLEASMAAASSGGGGGAGAGAGEEGFDISGVIDKATSSLSFFKVALLTLGPGGLALIGGFLTTLPALFTGAAAGAGVLALALEPVLKTLQALDQAKQSQATTDTTLAETQISNQESIQSAQNQVVSSTQAQTQAENSLQQAEFQEQQAQQALTLARQQAQFQLQDYTNQLADAALAQQGAAQAATQAKLEYDLVLSNPQATQLMRQEALLTYEQATQGITDQKTQYQQLQIVAAKAQSQGVEGMPAVVQANNAAQQSVLSVTYAQQALANAQIAAKQAAQNQVFAQEQANLALQSASGPAQTAQQDFNRLTGAGQEFVTFIENQFMPGVQQLSGMAQEALLPGLQAFLEDMMKTAPAWLPILQDAATGISDFLTALGGFYASPTGQSQIATLGQEAGTLMGDMAKMSVNWIEAWTTMGAQAGPIVDHLGSGMLSLSGDILKWTQDGGMQHFVNWMTQNGPELVKEFEAIAKTVGFLITMLADFDAAIAPIVIDLSHWTIDVEKFFERVGYDMGMFVSRDLVQWGDDFWHVLDGAWHILADFSDYGGHVMSDIWEAPTRAWHTFDNDVIHPIERFFTTDIEKWTSEATSALSKIPGVGLISSVVGDLSKIVPHAQGGYVDKPTLILAGEAGGEYIIPESMIGPSSPGLPAQGPFVSPSSASTGGGVTVNVNVNAQGATDPYAVAQATAAAVREVALQTTVRQTGNLYGVGAGRRG